MLILIILPVVLCTYSEFFPSGNEQPTSNNLFEIYLLTNDSYPNNEAIVKYYSSFECGNCVGLHIYNPGNRLEE